MLGHWTNACSESEINYSLDYLLETGYVFAIGLGSLVVKVKVLTENYMKTNFREGPVVMFPLK